MKILLAGILGGIVLFLWGAISWMALPWHNMTFEKFSDEEALRGVLAAQAPKSGVYIFPNAHPMDPGMSQEEYEVASKKSLALSEQGPLMLAAVFQGGMGGMGGFMARGFFIQVLGALVAAGLLSRTAGLGYGSRVLFVAGVALAGAIIGHLPYWNWWHFSTGYTLVTVADTLTGWLLAGLVMARIVPGKTTAA